MSAMVLGLRLGNTNTSAFVAAPGCAPMPVALEDASRLLPTVVGVDHDGRWVVGREALDLQAEDPSAVASRFLGPDTGTAGTVSVGEQNHEREDLAAEIVKHVLRRAQDRVRGTISGCVLCVPAYFDLAALNVMRLAVERAGVRLLRTIPDPLAAVLGAGFALLGAGTSVISAFPLLGDVAGKDEMDGLGGPASRHEASGGAVRHAVHRWCSRRADRRRRRQAMGTSRAVGKGRRP